MSFQKRGTHWWVAKSFEKPLLPPTFHQREDHPDAAAKKTVVIAPALLTAASSANCRDSRASRLPASTLPGKDPSWAFPSGRFQLLRLPAIHKKWVISSLMLSVFNASHYRKPTSSSGAVVF